MPRFGSLPQPVLRLIETPALEAGSLGRDASRSDRADLEPEPESLRSASSAYRIASSRGTNEHKTLLFTDQTGWSDAELVRGYRAQHHVESALRQFKDSDCIAIRPQYHWTDQKIAVHVFCCVLALMLCGLLQRELSRHGVPGSIPALLDSLRGIREIDVLYPAREADAGPELRTTLSRMTDEQRTMYDILSLEDLAI